MGSFDGFSIKRLAVEISYSTSLKINATMHYTPLNIFSPFPSYYWTISTYFWYDKRTICKRYIDFPVHNVFQENINRQWNERFYLFFFCAYLVLLCIHMIIIIQYKCDPRHYYCPTHTSYFIVKFQYVIEKKNWCCSCRWQGTDRPSGHGRARRMEPPEQEKILKDTTAVECNVYIIIII